MDSSTMIMIFAAVVFMVIPSLKDRVVPIRQLTLAPVIFLYFFYQSVIENFHLNIFNESVIVLGLVIGIIVGVFLRKPTRVVVDKNARLIALPGTYINLIMFSLIFITHFIIGYLKSVHPMIFTYDNTGAMVLLFMLACVSSISLGGNSCLYVKYFTSSSTVLHRMT